MHDPYTKNIIKIKMTQISKGLYHFHGLKASVL